jgi:hypothetical protein
MCWLRLQHARHVTRNQQLLLLLLLQVYEYERSTWQVRTGHQPHSTQHEPGCVRIMLLLLLLLLLLLQVYEYDRNLLQQDAVQYIAAYKYELGTNLAALNMSQFVRARPRVCDKNAQSGIQQQGKAGGIANRGAAALLPKPGGKSGPLSRGSRDGSSSGGLAAAGGFSMRSVLSAVSRDVQGAAGEKEQQQQQQQQQQQRTPQRSPAHSLPRPAGGESAASFLWCFGFM